MIGELVVLFKSEQALKADRCEILAKFESRWATILREDEAANAALRAEVDELSGPITAAAALKTKLAHVTAHYATLVKVRDAINSFNADFDEHNRLAKRSERFRRQLGR